MPLAGRACSNTTAGAHWSSRLREVDVLHFWLRRRVSTACLARIRLRQHIQAKQFRFTRQIFLNGLIAGARFGSRFPGGVLSGDHRR